MSTVPKRCDDQKLSKDLPRHYMAGWTRTHLKFRSHRTLCEIATGCSPDEKSEEFASRRRQPLCRSYVIRYGILKQWRNRVYTGKRDPLGRMGRK